MTKITNNIKTIIKKSTKITPEEEFKLRLKKTLKENEQNGLVKKIVKDIDDILGPFKNKMGSLEDDIRIGTQESKDRLLEIINQIPAIEDINTPIEKMNIELKEKIDASIEKLEENTNQKFQENNGMLDRNNEDIKNIIQYLSGLLEENRNGNIKLVDSIQAIPKTEINLEKTEQLLEKISLIDNTKDFKAPLQRIEGLLEKIQETGSIKYIELLLEQLYKKKGISTKDIEATLNNIYDVILKAWLPGEDAIQVVVKNQIQPTGGMPTRIAIRETPPTDLTKNNSAYTIYYNVSGEPIYIDEIINGSTYRTTITRTDMTVSSTLPISSSIQI